MKRDREKDKSGLRSIFFARPLWYKCKHWVSDKSKHCKKTKHFFDVHLCINCITSSIDFDFWPRRWPSTLALANTLVNWPSNLPWRKKILYCVLPEKKSETFHLPKNAWNYCRCAKKKIGVANVWKIIVRHYHYHHQCLSLALVNLIAMLYFPVLWMLKYRW